MTGAWAGGVVIERATLRAGAQPGPDDPGRHQHLGAARARAAGASSSTPGPLDEAHLPPCCGRRGRGRRVARSLLTHGHPDHAEGARRFAELTGAPGPRARPGDRLGDEGLGDGDVRDGRRPGAARRGDPGPHRRLALASRCPADRALLTGDTVLGRGTTVVAHPDGELGDYLDSLDRLRATGRRLGRDASCPGHGPVLPDAGRRARRTTSRTARERLEQVRARARGRRRRTPAEVGRVYADVDRSLWPAAELSVRAQLDYLRQRWLGRPRAGQRARREPLDVEDARRRGPRGAASRARRSRPAPC